MRRFVFSNLRRKTVKKKKKTETETERAQPPHKQTAIFLVLTINS